MALRFQAGPTTVVGTVIGVVLLVIGLVTFARTGLPPESLTGATTTVGPFTRTPLMGLIEIGLGLIVIVSGADVDRGALLGFGVISLVFGLVWIIEPGAFGGVLGVGTATGVLYLVNGVAAIAVGTIARVRRTRVVERTPPPV